MIRDTLAPRPLRISAALIGVAGTLALSGCSTAAADTTDAASTEASSSTESSTDTSTGTAGAAYADGTYTATGSYQTPETVETIEVTITLADDIITAVEVSGDPQASESERYQSEFIGGIDDEVVGQNIDEISVDRVAGSSLTSGGFNDAIDAIKDEAAA
ncbi:MAG: FMN-binding protein [Microbacterium sp.]|uniref:FMN-binding protein n=1 Tax=Microbacterium sp. TaxID=51671 RepID=UPI002715D0A4|nr:FMN-binding protein [Microbacterium sp.]MDO8384230.1 FMN-binding protein [Microbacterium sp.]